jgi:hypothetical protein
MKVSLLYKRGQGGFYPHKHLQTILTLILDCWRHDPHKSQYH